MRRPASAILLALLLLRAPFSLAVADGAFLEVSIESLEEDSIPVGTQILVTGKYKELIDGDLVLYGTKLRFRLSTPELKKRVLDFSAKRDNLVIEGTIRESSEGRSLEVLELSGGQSDLIVLSAEEEKLRSSGKDPVKGSVGLLKRVISAYSIQADPALLPLMHRLFVTSLGPKPRISEATVASRLEILASALQTVGDAKLIVGLGSELESRAGDPAPIANLLRNMGAKRRAGKWLTYAEFKQQEGFIEYEGRWILPRERDIYDAMERLRKQRQGTPVLRKRTDREYQLIAEKGTVEEGMKPEEVCAGLGYPDRVERRIYEGRELDQWTYNGRYWYFFDGMLVQRP